MLHSTLIPLEITTRCKERRVTLGRVLKQKTSSQILLDEELLFAIDINNMAIDGIGIYQVKNLEAIKDSFDSKAVYAFFINELDPSVLQKHANLLAELQNKALIDIFQELQNSHHFIGIESIFEDEQVLDIGYIEAIENNQILLKCVNVDGTIDQSPYPITFNAIIRIEINSRYLQVYENFIKQRNL